MTNKHISIGKLTANTDTHYRDWPQNIGYPNDLHEFLLCARLKMIAGFGWSAFYVLALRHHQDQTLLDNQDDRLAGLGIKQIEMASAECSETSDLLAVAIVYDSFHLKRSY